MVCMYVCMYLSTKRQKTFSEQVKVQVDQSFNDRLGRGVELLANDDAIMQSAGFEVLQDFEPTSIAFTFKSAYNPDGKPCSPKFKLES